LSERRARGDPQKRKRWCTVSGVHHVHGDELERVLASVAVRSGASWRAESSAARGEERCVLGCSKPDRLCYREDVFDTS
jgi:hypothetical protein